MNLERLKDLLSEAELMMPNVDDTSETDEFKQDVLQTMIGLFPNAKTTIGRIQRLDFEPTRAPNGIASDWRPFFDSKKNLIEILKAKLKHFGDVEVENTTVESKVLNLQITELSNKLKARDIELQKSVSREVESKKQADRLSNLILEKDLTISELSVENKSARRMRVFKDFATGGSILTGAFFLGIYLGTAKFDSDKINMADKIRANKTSIDSLNKIIKTQHDSIKSSKVK